MAWNPQDGLRGHEKPVVVNGRQFVFSKPMLVPIPKAELEEEAQEFPRHLKRFRAAEEEVQHKKKKKNRVIVPFATM